MLQLPSCRALFCSFVLHISLFVVASIQRVSNSGVVIAPYLTARITAGDAENGWRC